MFSRDSSIRSICVQREPVVLLSLQVVLLGDELVLVKGFLLLVGTLQAVHLRAVLQHVLPDIQFLLLHLDLRVAEDVLLLGQFGLGVQDLQVQVVVVQEKDGVAGLHAGTFFDEDLLDDAALLRAELDRRHRLHTAADADIVVELPFDGRRYRDGILVHPKRLVVRTGDQIDDERRQQRPQPPRQGLLRERHAPTGLLLDDLIHGFTDLRIRHHCNSALRPA